VPVSSAINQIKAYLAVYQLQEPSGSVSAYRHASPQTFKSGRKATTGKVHPLRFDGLKLFLSPFFQPPVDGGVLESYSPCCFVAFHAFSDQGLIPI
jgi:hypothetical protein